MVRPAWLRACARESPTLTPRLHCLTELFAVLHSTELLVTRDAGAVTGYVGSRSTGAVTKCRHAPAGPRKHGPRSAVLPAPQRCQNSRQVVRDNQDIPGLGALAGADDPPALQQVHQPARLGETHPQLALEHRGGPELSVDDLLSSEQQQIEVVADVGIDLPGAPLRHRDVLAVGGLRLLAAVRDNLPGLLFRDEGVLQPQRLARPHRQEQRVALADELLRAGLVQDDPAVGQARR